MHFVWISQLVKWCRFQSWLPFVCVEGGGGTKLKILGLFLNQCVELYDSVRL